MVKRKYFIIYRNKAFLLDYTHVIATNKAEARERFELLFTNQFIEILEIIETTTVYNG